MLDEMRALATRHGAPLVVESGAVRQGLLGSMVPTKKRHYTHENQPKIIIS